MVPREEEDRVGVKEQGNDGVGAAWRELCVQGATAEPSRDRGRPRLFLLGLRSTAHVPLPPLHFGVAV